MGDSVDDYLWRIHFAVAAPFGPWIKGDPGQTPLAGKYSFEHANLDTIKGIGGILNSLGEFSGHLEEIEVRAEVSLTAALEAAN